MLLRECKHECPRCQALPLRALDVPPSPAAGSIPMALQTINARIRGFICLNAHPEGCAANVKAQVARLAAAGSPGSGMREALVISASTGYGLSSILTAVFG